MRAALAWLVLLGGCVSPLQGLRDASPLEVGASRLVVRSDGSSADDVRRLRASIERALPALAGWGGLREAVTVYVVPTHDDLEAAVHRPGYGWLRAWSRFDDVIFQAPSTWTRRDDVLDQLVLHELTHCVLFQQAADRETWLSRRIPLWFREGMAIAVAGQAGQYPSRSESAAWLVRNPGLDVFADGEALSAGQAVEVYALGYHAYAALERRTGREGLLALIAVMRAGGSFEAAFSRTAGLTVREFQRDFEGALREEQGLEGRASAGAQDKER